jgi:hypothetical protein
MLPFATARENLLLVFERNRARYGVLVERAAQPLSSNEGRRLTALQAQVGTCFVRLHGMLFDRINLEQFDEVLARGQAALKQLLVADSSFGALLQQQQPYDSVLLCLVVLSTFSVHAAHGAAGSDVLRGGGRAAGQGLQPEQQQAQLGYASAALLGLAATLLTCTAELPQGSPALEPYMAACHLLLQFCCQHSGLLVSEPAAGLQCRPTLAQRLAFWRAAGGFAHAMGTTFLAQGLGREPQAQVGTATAGVWWGVVGNVLCMLLAW